jgi:hypothetical protein
MAFENEWDETLPTDINYGLELDDYHRKALLDIRERAAVQHNAYADETDHTDVWEHKPGECTVVFVGAKADFPEPSTSNKGCFAMATDEGNQIYYWNGTAWAKVQEPVLITGNQTIAGVKTFSSAPIFSAGLVVGQDTDVGDYNLRAKTLQSDVATGTAPLTVASTTQVANLNAATAGDADTLDGRHGNAQFGAWYTMNYNTQYVAATDGIVCAYIHTSVDEGDYIEGETPTNTERVRAVAAIDDQHLSITFPVRKGDTWKVYSYNSGAYVYWLPIGG